MIDTDALRWLLAKATPGEWEVRGDRTEFVTIGNCGDDGFGIATPGIPGGNYRDTEWGDASDDEALVVAAVNALPSLLDEVEALRRDRDRLDWLESQREAYGFEHEHLGNRWVLDGPFNTARAAIDSARNAGG